MDDLRALEPKRPARGILTANTAALWRLSGGRQLFSVYCCFFSRDLTSRNLKIFACGVFYELI